jgi:speckle-type POZ protein
MFANKMLESSMNTVEIVDFGEDIVKEMLKYMYTGKLESIPDDKALDLLQIAEKYDLPGLRKKCEYIMTQNLSVETAIDVLIVANLHNADMLKAKAIDFITRY